MMRHALAPSSAAAVRSITLLGSTGSIGTSTLKLVSHAPERYRVEVLTAFQNVELLIEQCREFSPHMAVIADEAHYPRLKEALSGTSTKAACGIQALIEAASLPSDITMSAMVGAAGLAPTLAAIRRGATVALANKECLVSAGSIVMQEVARYGARLLPVDSEHNAIFQLFDFERPEQVEAITITASGGPFRDMPPERMQSVTPQEAVRHPNWSMGAKISVDSATMMNKGLELIEAYHLFPLGIEQIEVIVHPESIIHGMVRMRDGSTLAQMGAPDMCIPIAHALAWPQRMHTPCQRLDFAKLGSLTFYAPDPVRFPALGLARNALAAGGNAPTILNAANEVAVARFLAGEIGFLAIAQIVEKTLEALPHLAVSSLEDVLEWDKKARHTANNTSS